MTDRPAESRPPCVELLDPAMVAIYRGMSPGERVRRGLEATEFVRDRIRAHLKGTRPDWSDEQVAAELARRISRDWS